MEMIRVFNDSYSCMGTVWVRKKYLDVFEILKYY